MSELAENATPVCILGGGLGTRLGAITEALPKPMVRVGSKPFLQLILDHLVGLGFRRFILAVHYRWEAMREYFGDGSALNCRIEYSVEPEPLGTGGAVLWAQPLWGSRVLVLNGDTYLPVDWRDMLAEHADGSRPVTMALVRSEQCDRFGQVCVQEGRVIEFLEKHSGGGAGWINGGVYALDAAAMVGRRRGEAFSLERDVFPPLAGSINAYLCPDVPFADIGTPESLERFRQEAESRTGTGV
ncbi:hypothetical protein LCGC14_2938720 [marine sediment metagenome]|uniref:Nucleotidyl transferase domain-containing protein n=1 Tax=marine sediment metagenome TaxID=412755 RepID=A0A0F8Y5R4_9ZZZZ